MTPDDATVPLLRPIVPVPDPQRPPSDETVVIQRLGGSLPFGERSGDYIGPYQLIEPLGEGGFGTVWRAEQKETLHREVALKLIKAGMDSREVIARFEAERQALALMDHPNIAAVLDAGTTSQGRPYFVMELVRGLTITQYCDTHELGIRQRLELFIPVCQAVQHAHQKAILHRDLKPSNILVAEVDGRPVPKVIDFGIAKALHATDEPVFHATLARTLDGLIVGTPQYMSPEQAGSVPDVDTRSDIYTLGVILYELLVGDTPLSRAEMKMAALDEVLRLVREVEPRKPSSRFSPVTELAKTAASLRQMEPKKLENALRGDLDWIVFKALEKDRARRYDSATAFAQDLRRHLDEEPVSARSPSVKYRLGKLVRRNKGAFTAAVIIVLSMVSGIAVSTWQAVRATHAESLAKERLQEVAEQKNQVVTAQKEIEGKNAVLTSQVEKAALSERLVAQDLLRLGRGPDAMAHLARAEEYTPDTSFAAEKAVAALNDWRFPLPLIVLARHEKPIKSAKFSPDGSRIMTEEEGAVRIWDSLTGKLLTTLKTKEKRLCASQFSPDGLKIATATLEKKMADQLSINDEVARFMTAALAPILAASDDMVQIWDASTGNLLTRLAANQSENERSGKGGVSVAVITGLAGHNGLVTSLQFSNDSERLMTVTQSGRVKMWEAGTGNLLFNLQGSGLSAHFSPDGERIVTASYETRVWDSHSGQVFTTFKGDGQNITSAQFDAIGHRVLTTAIDSSSAQVWDSDNGRLALTLQTPSMRGIGHQLLSARFSPDGQRIVTVADDKKAWVWEAYTGNLVATLQGHGSQLTSAEFSPDNKRIVTASDDKTACIWDSTSGKLLSTLQGHGDKVVGAQFSPDGRQIVTTSNDGTARVWDSNSSGNLQSVLQDAGMVGSPRFSPDGQSLVTVSHNEAQVWESASGRLLTTLQGHGDRVVSAQFSPDNQRVVTASMDSTARVWESASGKLLAPIQGQEVDEFLAASQQTRLLAKLEGHANTVWSAQFSPDNLRIVTTSEDGTARVWESASGKLLATLQGDKYPIRNAMFSADGQRIVTLLQKGKEARVWESASGKLAFLLKGHERAITSVEYSPDGRHILSASQDKTARVWDGASGHLLTTLKGHEQDVTSARFSPDGRRIVTASDDMTARVWESASGRLLAVLKGHEDKITSAEFSPDGQRILTSSADQTTRIWDAGGGRLLAVFEKQANAVSNAQFSPDGWQVLIEGDGKPRIWEILGTSAPPPPWFADFLRLMGQRKVNDDGEVVMMSTAEFLAVREKLKGIAATERSRYAAIARWFLAPASKRPPRPGKE